MSKGFSVPLGQAVNAGQVKFGTESSAIMFSPELSIFVTNDDAFPSLADLWDAREGKMMYGTRQKGEWNVTDAQLTLLACSSPEWLTRTIPATAVAGGFTRRVNFIYARNKRPVGRGSRNGADKKRDALVEDLRYMSTLSGEFRIAPDVIREITKLREAQPDEFEDEATAGYVATKYAHALKLSMILCAAKRDTLVIERDTFDAALARVNDCERDLKLVFRAVGESDLASVADKVLRFLEARQHATRKQIMAAVWKDVIGQDLDMILGTLEQGGLIMSKQSGNSTIYYPTGLNPAASAATQGAP